MTKHPPIEVIAIEDLNDLPRQCYMYYQWELEPAIEEHRKRGHMVETVYMWKHITMGYASFFIEFEEVKGAGQQTSI